MKVVEEGVQTKVVSDFDKTVQTKGKTVPPLTRATVAEQQEPLKSSWLKQKFLGLPVWGWIVIVLIVAWAGIIVGLVVAR